MFSETFAREGKNVAALNSAHVEAKFPYKLLLVHMMGSKMASGSDTIKKVCGRTYIAEHLYLPLIGL